jgi:hypothetical protein
MRQQVWRDLFNRAGAAAEAARLNKSGAPSAAFQFKAYGQDDTH